MNTPLLTGRSIICISWLDWDWLPLVPHHMMARFAKHNRVLYVDPTIALSTFVAHPSQSRALVNKLKRWISGVREVSDNLYVYYPHPLLVTSGHMPATDAMNRRWLGWSVKRTAARLGLVDPILWLYDPYVIEPSGQFHEQLVCYDCNDDTSSFASLGYKQRNMEERDASLARRADLVLATSRQLYRQKKALNSNTHYLPSGVDFDLFNSALNEDVATPTELADVDSSVVGYVGSITNYRIEWDWIEALARRMPSVTVVMIGPVIEPPPSSLTGLANIRFVGAKPPAELPGYLKRCDVGIIPYKGEAFLKACQPTKTFEYLAAGLGVVSAPIPDLQPFSDVVHFASNAQEFVQQTQHMLQLASDEDFRKRCVEVARNQTWDARFSAASELVCKALQTKTAKPTAMRSVSGT